MSANSLPSFSPSPPSSQRTTEARAAFIASLQSVGQSLDSDLQSRARTIHENARVLSEQEKKLAKSTKALQKETNQLEKFLNKNKKGGKAPLSEFDDLEELLGSLESELDVLDRTLGIVEGDVEEQEGVMSSRADVEGHDEGVERAEVIESENTIIGKGKQTEQGAVEDRTEGAVHAAVSGSSNPASVKG